MGGGGGGGGGGLIPPCPIDTRHLCPVGPSNLKSPPVGHGVFNAL